MFAKFHSHLRGGPQITRVLGIAGGYPGMGIPKTRGYPNHCDSASRSDWLKLPNEFKKQSVSEVDPNTQIMHLKSPSYKEGTKTP